MSIILSYLKPKILLLSISLFGYGIIASFIKDASTSRLVTVPYRAIVISLSILVLAVLLFQKNTNTKKYTKKNKQGKVSLFSFLLIFVIFYSFRLIYDLGYNNSLTKESSEYLLNWFGICLIPGITFLFLDSKYSEKYLYLSWVFLVIASIFALPMIFQGQSSTGFGEQGRLAGEALNPISLGHQSASLVLISMYNLLKEKSNDLNQYKIIKNASIFSLIIGVVLLVSAASRGPIIATIGATLCKLISLMRQGVNIFKIISIVIITYVIINFCLSFASASGSTVLERFSSFLEGSDFDDTKFVGRPELYQKASELITENPIFGYGLEVPDLGYPHNLILEAFLATGLLGGSLFLMLYIYAAIKAISIIMAKNNTWSWLGLIYIQYAIGIMFSGSLYGSYTFWYLFFAIVGLKRNRSNNNQ